MMAAMSKIYGSSGRQSDPLSNMGVVVGIVAAVLAAILWYFHFQSTSDLLGIYSGRVAPGGDLHDQVRVLSAVLGTMAVVAGIGGSLGGRGRASSVAALLLGVAGLSYWVLTALDVFTRVVPTPL
jgi:hypothetical protein